MGPYSVGLIIVCLMDQAEQTVFTFWKIISVQLSQTSVLRRYRMLTYIFLTLLFVSDVDGDEELDINISSNGIGRRLPSARQQRSSNRSVQRVTESRLENVRPGQMIRTKEFGVLWATFFLNTQVPPRIVFLTRASAKSI